MRNRRVILASRPKGVAQAENFAIVESELEPLAEGQIRVRNDFLSVDPAMRGWINWVRAGKLKYEEDILDGLEACPDALAGLYPSENRGKRVIRVTR